MLCVYAAAYTFVLKQEVIRLVCSGRKGEGLPGMEFKCSGEARASTLEWLLWYNGPRMHSDLRYLNAAQFEQQALVPPLALAARPRRFSRDPTKVQHHNVYKRSVFRAGSAPRCACDCVVLSLFCCPGFEQ